MKSDNSLTPYTKISSKWIKDLNVRLYTIKLLEENTSRTLWHKLQQYLFWPISQDNVNENKKNTNGTTLNSNFCTAKETINKMKRHPTDGEKIFANDMVYKGLVSKIYKQLMMVNSIKTNNSIKKWAEDLNRCFPQEDIQMAKRHIKRCSTSLIIREMKNKTTMSYHLTLARMAIIKKIHK